MSQDQPPDKESAAPDDVWGQLDDDTRARVIELFAHLGYQYAVTQHEESMKEDKDVYPRRDTKDQARAH